MIKKLTDTELKEMTRQQLCDYCRANKIKGYSGKNKAQRVDLILKHYGSVSTKQQLLTDAEIMDKLSKLQFKYNHDSKKFHKDPEFIRLSKLLIGTRRTPIKLQKAIEVKQPIKKATKTINYGKIDVDEIAQLKIRRERVDKRRDERNEYWSSKILNTKDYAIKNNLRKMKVKEIRKISNEIDNIDNKIIRHQLNYFKIRVLIRKTLGERSKSHSTAIRGYRSYSSGHDIEAPTIWSPIIRISWNAGGFVSGEREEASNQAFKDKLIPVLKANNIPFTETSSEIHIKKID